MYMFSRTGRVSNADGFAWAEKITKVASEASDSPVNLWAAAFSPGYGTMTWSQFWPDLAGLETNVARLNEDASYLALAAEASNHLVGGVDDALLEILNVPAGAEEAPMPNYVWTVEATGASGGAVSSVVKGLELAQRASAITGVPTLFARRLTGVFGGVEWMSGYDSLAAFQTAQEKLAADPTWGAAMDAVAGVYAEDSRVTQSILRAKIA